MSPLPPDRAAWTGFVLSASVLLLLSFVSPGCSSFKDCDSCVPHAKCLWCFTTNNCTDYPVTWWLPPASLCPLSQARWGVCWLNFEALIIALAVVVGTILISIVICCCCCCCCKSRQSGLDRDDERFARRREEIRQRAEERKVERQSRHDEIRRKYGLMGTRTTRTASLRTSEAAVLEDRAALIFSLLASFATYFSPFDPNPDINAADHSCTDQSRAKLYFPCGQQSLTCLRAF